MVRTDAQKRGSSLPWKHRERVLNAGPRYNTNNNNNNNSNKVGMIRRYFRKEKKGNNSVIPFTDDASAGNFVNWTRYRFAKVRRSCTRYRCILYASVKIGGTGNEIPGTSSRGPICRSYSTPSIPLPLFREYFFPRSVVNFSLQIFFVCTPAHMCVYIAFIYPATIYAAE